MYDRILLPTDGSDVAAVATDAAIALAGQFGADLHVLYVAESGSDGAGDTDTDGERAVARAARLAADADIEPTTAVVEGDAAIHRSIRSYADGHDVDCIVMGTHGRTGLDRYFVGSVAERTLRASPVPVLTVHEETVLAPAFDSLLVPTDGSDCARAAVDHALDLALATGAALHVVYVVDRSAVQGAGSGTTAGGAVLDALGEAGQRALEAATDRAERAGVRAVETSVLSGTPYRAIVDYADDRGVDCVVMGTHGRTGLSRYFVGSVTERVVRLADVPVLALGGADGTA